MVTNFKVEASTVCGSQIFVFFSKIIYFYSSLHRMFPYHLFSACCNIFSLSRSLHSSVFGELSPNSNKFLFYRMLKYLGEYLWFALFKFFKTNLIFLISVLYFILDALTSEEISALKLPAFGQCFLITDSTENKLKEAS